MQVRGKSGTSREGKSKTRKQRHEGAEQAISVEDQEQSVVTNSTVESSTIDSLAVSDQGKQTNTNMVVQVEDEEPTVEVCESPAIVSDRVAEAPPSAPQLPSSTSQSDLQEQRSNNSPYFWRRLYKRHLLSLSRAPTTPFCLSILIPLLSIMTHLIFYYGQTRPMWHLHLSEQADVWINATTVESRGTLDVLGLPHENYMPFHKEKQVKTFTYWYAIQELWKGKNLPGKLLPRFAAVLLVVFSGIWPHLKLLLLNFTWMFSIHQKRRTRILHWLGTLGKWSLADVLVVCVMVGVLDLDWQVDPQAIRNGLIKNLPVCLKIVKSLYSAEDVCTMAMKNLDCHVHHKSWKLWSKCNTCITVVKSALDNPKTARKSFKGVLDGIHMSGGGEVALRVMGLHGIYAFCTAVILSILISLAVDIVDVRAQRTNLRNDSSQEQEYRQFLLPNGDDGSTSFRGDENDESNEGDSYDMNEPSLLLREYEEDNHHRGSANDLENGGDEAYHAFIQSTSSQPRYWLSIIGRYTQLALCLVTLFAVGAGIFSNTIQRTVQGAIPAVLRDVLGFVWNRPYSLFTLVQTTGAAGGWDYLLMGTFGLFVVAGPAIRAVLCLLSWLVPLKGSNQQKLLATIELVGAFCAWEVFIVAVCMVDMLMPSITSTVIMKPECKSISDDGKCLEVDFDLQKPFHWILIGGSMLIVLSNWIAGDARRPGPNRGRGTFGSGSTTHYTAIGHDDM